MEDHTVTHNTSDSKEQHTKYMRRGFEHHIYIFLSFLHVLVGQKL